MYIKRLAVGQLAVNCYIIGDEETKEAMIIDPGDEPDRIIDAVNVDRFKITKLICTHTHFDHVGAMPELKLEYNADIMMHKDEIPTLEAAKDMAFFWGFSMSDLPKADIYVNDGDVIGIGSLSFTVFHTPGHSPGGICLYGHDILLSGDTLFADSVGRTDLPGGDAKKLKTSFNRLMTLPESTNVLPGHGPQTNIGREKVSNFFAH